MIEVVGHRDLSNRTPQLLVEAELRAWLERLAEGAAAFVRAGAGLPLGVAERGPGTATAGDAPEAGGRPDRGARRGFGRLLVTTVVPVTRCLTILTLTGSRFGAYGQTLL
ncbi:hypothetical protein ABZ695_24865 [Streptomyces sp. NPDC006976]|uniref:hypothetical protein n=1 Tax=Streptomyces sp. NPDC006976 TaxID=3154311 RepID=UPI00340B8A90